MKDQDGNVPRQLLIGLGALVAVALVVGGLISVAALGAANLAGVGSGGEAVPEEPSLYIPPTASPSSAPAVPESQPPAPSLSAKPKKAPPPKTRKPRSARPQIILSARPKTAATSARVYLTGRYRRNGATLQVQRFEGRWVDFPVSATVRGRGFETYVQSGQDGRNRFRVVDKRTGRSSPPVTVTFR